jgi:hypothetical protein
MASSGPTAYRLVGTAICCFIGRPARSEFSHGRRADPATVLTLFCLGSCSLPAIWLDFVAWALVPPIVGYSAIFLLDPIAADAGEAPLYFPSLRRLQMPIIILALIIAVVIAPRG